MITFNVNFQTFLPVMHYIYKVFYIMEWSGICCPRPWNSPLCIIKQEFRSTLFCLKTKGDKSSLYSRNKKRFYSWHPQHSNKPPFGIHHFSCRFLHKLAITAWTISKKAADTKTPNYFVSWAWKMQHYQRRGISLRSYNQTNVDIQELNRD